MARICPQCREIHFETTDAPLPTHCRKCEADLNGVSDVIAAYRFVYEQINNGPVRKSKAKAPGLTTLIVGVIVSVVAGIMTTLGMINYINAEKTEAKVMLASNAVNATAVPKWAIRDKRTAEYTVKGKPYYCYPGVRTDGQTFPIYYAPSDPIHSSEERPFLVLVVGVLVGLCGGFLTWKGILVLVVRSAQKLEHEKSMRVAY